jgi:branched-chain amino acid transport system substrate-binding protein
VIRELMRAAKGAGAQKIALLSLEPLGTEPYLRRVQQQATAQGLALTGAERFGLDATDLTAPVQAALAGQPDALVVNALPPYDVMVVRAARAAGWQGTLLLPPSAAHPGFHPGAGPAAEDATLIAPWLAAPDQAPTALPNGPTMRRFSESFAAVNGAAGSHAGYGADAVSLLHLAYLGHRDRKAAREALEQMCCVGVSGVFNMTGANHAGLDQAALTTLTSRGGRWVGAAEVSARRSR